MNPMRKLTHFLAFGFGAGKLTRAPGTFGTLVGIPVYLLLQPLSPLIYGVVVLVLFSLGVWLCHVTEKDLGMHDHPGIVWDEIVGYLITMFMAPAGWEWMVLGFFLFRLFDIWKPFPIRQIERRIQGGLGNMLDDALAAVYAWFVLQAVVHLVPLM
ncbi:MAG: phosphatidylglycerophosphatase A [Gammaproteobacteria bacterium]|nr:phosphatidylglycerophosphatase A [Gammaproteobacteria bacterium]